MAAWNCYRENFFCNVEAVSEIDVSYNTETVTVKEIVSMLKLLHTERNCLQFWTCYTDKIVYSERIMQCYTGREKRNCFPMLCTN